MTFISATFGFDLNCFLIASLTLASGYMRRANDEATAITFVILVRELREVSPIFSPTFFNSSM